MADYANYTFLTHPTIAEEGDPVLGPIIDRLRHEGHNTIHVLKKWMTVAPTDTEAEIRTGYTNLFDGVATPILIAIDSSDNNQDKAAGTGAKTASMLLVNDSHLMCEETFTLVGTTVVDSTADLYEHFNDMKLLTYGSDGNPTGTIQAINHADTEVYGTIANTGHCTVNARTYVPAGYAGYLVLNAKAWYVGIASGGTGLSTTEGAQVRFKYVTLDANEPTDLVLMQKLVTQMNSPCDITPPQVVRAGATDEYVTVLADVMDEDVNGLLSLEWTILMWV